MAVWTSPATPVTLTPWTVAFYGVNIRDNLNVLRANTGSGDPTTAGQVAYATGAGVTTWGQLLAASYADGSVTDVKLANAPIHKAGDSGIGSLTLAAGQAFGFGAGGTLSEAAGVGTFLAVTHDVFVVTKQDGSAQILNATPTQFNWMGHAVVRVDGGQDFSGVTPPTIGGSAVVTTSNITSFTAGSAILAADSSNLGAIPAASYARLNALANFTSGLQSGGSAVVTAASIGGLTAGSATLAIDSSNLGAIPAASYVRLSAGQNFTTTAPTILGSAIITAATIGSQTVAQVANRAITDVQVALANIDGTTSTASLRTLGTGAQQAAAGNHTHSLMAKIKTGSYSGNSTTHAITGVGFAPQSVIVSDVSGNQMCLLQNGLVIGLSGAGAIGGGTVSMDADGFSFTNAGAGANTTGHSYGYVAFG